VKSLNSNTETRKKGTHTLLVENSEDVSLALRNMDTPTQNAYGFGRIGKRQRVKDSNFKREFTAYLKYFRNAWKE
jgi:hypothetical protein